MEYIIKRGSFKPEGFHFKPYLFKSSISAAVIFDESAVYDPMFAEGYNGFSKLFGLSFPTPHWISSARFAWRSLGARGIEIVPYVYDNGKRIYRAFFEEINTKLIIPPDKRFHFSIDIANDLYLFNVKDDVEAYTTAIPKHSSRFFIATQNYPYFGGQYPAPRDIKINMQIF